MKKVPRSLRWLTLLGFAFLVGACGVGRPGAKKRRKVRMPCPCNLHHHFPVYLTYANEQKSTVSPSLKWAHGSYPPSKRLCRRPDR